MRGTITTSNWSEIFSHSLAIQSAASADAVAGQMRTQWSNIWGTGASGIGNIFPTPVVYTEVTVAQILAVSGDTVPTVGAAVHAPFTPPLPGRSPAAMLPPQNAIAVSLTGGAKANGAPHKGRFYLPVPATDHVLTDGKLNTVDRDLLATNLLAFFDVLTQNGIYPSIWSKKYEELALVSTLRVGDRIDTVRRRRNAHVEAYAVEAVPGPQ